jgi:hypothetical protein
MNLTFARFFVYSVTMLSSLLLAKTTEAQIPYFIPDINNRVTVYDAEALQQLPLLNIGVITFDGGIDSNFIGIVDPKNNFKRWLDYPFPNSNLQSGWDDLFFMSPVNNSESWYTAKINTSLGAPLEPTDIEYISILDRELNMTETVTMAQTYTYQYHGRDYDGLIRFDSHDRNAFERNGVQYILAIGTRLEWYDASNSWVGEDSMRVRFTSLHIIDATTGEEKAKWDPQMQGYRMEDFGLPYHLQTLFSGIKMYSHPHINVLNPYVDVDGGSGVSIYASARHPGTVSKLRWDGVSTTLQPEWMFGQPAHDASPTFYLPTTTTNQLDACHGSSAFVSGDTTYIATYNNKPDFANVGGRHQVYKVFDNKAELMWQSPELGIETICKGDAKWSADGRFLLTTHGNCPGTATSTDEHGNLVSTNTFEKFNIWNPWQNSKVLGMQFEGSMYVALMDFVAPEKMVTFEPITYTVSDSIRFSHAHNGLVYWTVGLEKVLDSQLTLSLDYLDSLDIVAAWIRTGSTGAWRVEEKTSIITDASLAEVTKLSVATIQQIGATGLPSGYSWTAHSIVGQALPISEIHTPGIYVLSAFNPRQQLVYRGKHIFVQ